MCLFKEKTTDEDSSVEIVGIFSKTQGKKVFRKTSFSLRTSEK